MKLILLSALMGANPLSYAVTSGTPGQEPIQGSLPGHSYGIVEHEFSERLAVTVGDQQVTVDPTVWSPSCRRA